MIWSLIVGGLLGWFASLITGRDVPGGVIGNIIAGIIGSWIGTKLLGSFDYVIGGFAIIPALIGAVILIFIVSFTTSNAEMNVAGLFTFVSSPFIYYASIIQSGGVSIEIIYSKFPSEDNAKATTVHKLSEEDFNKATEKVLVIYLI